MAKAKKAMAVKVTWYILVDFNARIGGKAKSVIIGAGNNRVVMLERLVKEQGVRNPKGLDVLEYHEATKSDAVLRCAEDRHCIIDSGLVDEIMQGLWYGSDDAPKKKGRKQG